MSAVDELDRHRPLVAILRGVRPGEVEAIGEALAETGIGIVEVPLNSPDPFASIERLARRLAGRALVGAGTVLAVADVARVHDAGGRLVVSPDCKPAVIRATVERGMASLPGTFTPTEAFAALDAGAHGLKLFPASLIGPAGVKAVRAVLPEETRVYAVGGVDETNLGEWLAAGATGFGVGSALYRPGMTAAEVGERARAFVGAYDAIQDAAV